ncbi:MAG: hypothetical protein QOI38_1151 [Sphingomonadales bacterium]|jgi:hypothetical protein|nr:hypothetical protein [Sphingomonadales bacterium]
MKPQAAAFALILLAGCARSEDASVRPAESNESYSAVEQVRRQQGDEREPALGEWRRSLQEDQPSLEFGPAGTAPLVTVACVEGGGLVLQRAGAVPPGSAATVTVAIGGQTRQLTMGAAGGSSPAQRTALAGGDPLIQQLASAQAPIILRFGDGTALVLPPSPLIGAFATGCANGFPRETAAAGAAPDAGNAQSAPAGNEANAASGR